MTQSYQPGPHDLQPIEVLPNKEDVRIIWLDANIDYLDDTRYMKDLLEINPATQLYTCLTKCISLIKSIQDEHIILVVSDAFADQILSQIHNLRSLAEIFILCEINTSFVKLRSKYSRILNIFTDRDSLLASVRDTFRILQKQSVAFSFFDQKQKSTRDLSKESSTFIWYQLLIDALNKMPHDKKAKTDMLKLCTDYYQNDPEEKKQIKKFDDSYEPEEAIAWYTRECFLFKLLNKALRTEDIELLYLFRFFIADLCTQLKKANLKITDNLPLYRGQQLPNEELEKLRQNVGGLISTNGFLSTSRNYEEALKFSDRSKNRIDMAKCIFEIRVDPSLKSIVLADTVKHSKFPDEEDVLFALNATFKVGLPYMDDKIQMWKVPLIATDEGVAHLAEYLKAQEYEMEDYCPMVYFGRILWRDLGRVDRAKKYFDMLLKTLPPNHPDISDVYNEVAPLWAELGDQEKALEYYEKAFRIREETLESNHRKISISLNNIGITYAAMGKNSDTLYYYNRSLAINQKITPKPNQDWALRLLNAGFAYLEEKYYKEAFELFHQAYDIYKQVRPPQHRDIAWCLGAIGNLYYMTGDIDSALNYYHQQLEMNEKCLSLDHPDISANIECIADIYVIKKNRDPQEALAFCEEKLATQKNDLGEDHPRVASTLMKIGKLLREDRKYLDQALLILIKYSPKDDLRTIKCLQELSKLDEVGKNYDDALKHWKSILDIRRRIHSPDNPKIASTLCDIGDIYFKYLQKYSEAHRYYSESLNVYNANYGPQHETIIKINKKIMETDSKLEDDEDTFKNMTESMRSRLSPSESATVIPESTMLASFVTASSNDPPVHQANISSRSVICVLL